MNCGVQVFLKLTIRILSCREKPIYYALVNEREGEGLNSEEIWILRLLRRGIVHSRHLGARLILLPYDPAAKLQVLQKWQLPREWPGGKLLFCEWNAYTIFEEWWREEMHRPPAPSWLATFTITRTHIQRHLRKIPRKNCHCYELGAGPWATPFVTFLNNERTFDTCLAWRRGEKKVNGKRITLSSRGPMGTSPQPFWRAMIVFLLESLCVTCSRAFHKNTCTESESFKKNVPWNFHTLYTHAHTL